MQIISQDLSSYIQLQYHTSALILRKSSIPTFICPAPFAKKQHCIVLGFEEKPISAYRLTALYTDTLDFIVPIIFEQVTIFRIKLMFPHQPKIAGQQPVSSARCHLRAAEHSPDRG